MITFNGKLCLRSSKNISVAPLRPSSAAKLVCQQVSNSTGRKYTNTTAKLSQAGLAANADAKKLTKQLTAASTADAVLAIVSDHMEKLNHFHAVVAFHRLAKVDIFHSYIDLFSKACVLTLFVLLINEARQAFASRTESCP